MWFNIMKSTKSKKTLVLHYRQYTIEFILPIRYSLEVVFAIIPTWLVQCFRNKPIIRVNIQKHKFYNFIWIIYPNSQREKGREWRCHSKNAPPKRNHNQKHCCWAFHTPLVERLCVRNYYRFFFHKIHKVLDFFT